MEDDGINDESGVKESITSAPLHSDVCDPVTWSEWSDCDALCGHRGFTSRHRITADCSLDTERTVCTEVCTSDHVSSLRDGGDEIGIRNKEVLKSESGGKVYVPGQPDRDYFEADIQYELDELRGMGYEFANSKYEGQDYWGARGDGENIFNTESQTDEIDTSQISSDGGRLNPQNDGWANYNEDSLNDRTYKLNGYYYLNENNKMITEHYQTEIFEIWKNSDENNNQYMDETGAEETSFDNFEEDDDDSDAYSSEGKLFVEDIKYRYDVDDENTDKDLLDKQDVHIFGEKFADVSEDDESDDKFVPSSQRNFKDTEETSSMIYSSFWMITDTPTLKTGLISDLGNSIDSAEDGNDELADNELIPLEEKCKENDRTGDCSMCEYGDWGAWEICSVECGGGNVSRYRELTRG